MGQAVSSNCGGVDVFVGVAAPSMTVTTAGKQSNYVLDDSNGLGQSSPGMGLYKETQFFFRGARTGRYSVLLISRKEVRLAHREMMPLQQPAQACKVLVLLSAALSNGALRTVLTKQFTVDNYVTIVADLDVTNDAVQTLDPSPESLAWVQDQLDHAEKETSRASGSAGGGQAPEDGLPTDPRARHQKPAPGDESVRATQDSMRAKGGTPAPGQKPEGADDLKALRQKPQPAPAAVQELRKGVEQQPSSAPPQPGGQN
jgi:hypothetical protein